MIDPTTTTGTEPQDDGTSLESAESPGTPEGDNRNAESQDGDKDWKALAISLQEKAAKVNELERKLAELEGDSPQPPVVESPEVQAKTDQIDTLLEKAEAFKRQGDPVAALALETRAELLSTQRDLILQRQLDRIPQERQDQVLKHFNKNRHRIGDINAADAELRTPSLEREVAELRQKLAKLEKGPDPEVLKAPTTHGHEFTARETKKKLTEADFDATAQRIRTTQGELAYLKFVRENAGSIQ